MPNILNHNDPRRPRGNNKKKPEQSQTVIIPQITPEMLAQNRKAAQPAPKAAPQPAASQIDQEKTQIIPDVPKAAPPPAPKPAERPARRSRAQAEQELYQTIHDDHLWLNNPVMTRGLGLAPLVVAATDADNALMLCVAAALLLTLTRVLAVAVCHLTGNRFRSVVYVYSAAVLYIPAYFLMSQWFGASLAVLGIYLPLLVVEPAIVKRREAPELESIGEAFRRGINNTLGLCIALMLIGCLRELLGAGTLFGNDVLHYALLPLASQPAGGFLLLGVVCAAWTGIGGAYVHYKLEEVRHLYADRKR